VSLSLKAFFGKVISGDRQKEPARMVSNTGSFGTELEMQSLIAWFGVESSHKVKSNRDLTLSGSGMPHSGVGAMGRVVVLPLNMELNLRTTDNVDAFTGVFSASPSVCR
jgi:hypothetical protein